MYGSAYGTPINELILNKNVGKSISFTTCQYVKANLFTCFEIYQFLHDILLSCFVKLITSQMLHEMLGTLCTLLSGCMLTCKHSEVRILKTHLRMLS